MSRALRTSRAYAGGRAERASSPVTYHDNSNLVGAGLLTGGAVLSGAASGIIWEAFPHPYWNPAVLNVSIPEASRNAMLGDMAHSLVPDAFAVGFGLLSLALLANAGVQLFQSRRS